MEKAALETSTVGLVTFGGLTSTTFIVNMVAAQFLNLMYHSGKLSRRQAMTQMSSRNVRQPFLECAVRDEDDSAKGISARLMGAAPQRLAVSGIVKVEVSDFPCWFCGLDCEADGGCE